MRTLEKLKLGATPLAVIAAAATLAACGGSSDANTDSGSSPAGGPGQGGFANLSADDIQCLKDQGVTLPSGPPDGTSGPSGVQPPQGAPPEGMTGASGPQGAPPSGTPPQGAPQGGFDPQEMQAAMEACGIDVPQPEGGQTPPSGMPGASSESSGADSSASDSESTSAATTKVS